VITEASPVTGANRARNPKVREWLESFQPRLLINNQWVPAKSGKSFETIDPTSENVLCLVAEGDKADVNEAVTAARRAFEEGAWGRSSPHERARSLRRLAGLIEDHDDELCELESLDTGMTVSTARAFLALAVECLYYYAGSAPLIQGETMPSEPTSFYYSLRQPLGVVGAIIPWNGPTISTIWKIGPALASGNTVILKPAEQAQLSALRLGELALEAGLPDGVLNIITGYGPGAGSSIAEHPGVDKVTFTGSTEVGKKILAASAGNLKRVTLELGGKSPNIVFPDANLDDAVPASLAAYSVLAGQACVAGTRLFVQRECKDEFVGLLADHTSKMKVGDPLEIETTMGPLASKEQFDRVRDYLNTGKEEGATARVGGDIMGGRGYFVQPTIFDDVDNSMRIAREEIFGPVVSIIPFTDEYDAVLQGNDTDYGLGAAVWTRDVSCAHRVARQLKAGSVWVNNYLTLDPTMPFGGFKQSGIGREMGAHWYEHFTEQKAVFVKL
jgi:acyl-CoA reductase-like NAD-dependent aldehyde dehydrogenase